MELVLERSRVMAGPPGDGPVGLWRGNIHRKISVKCTGTKTKKVC